MDAHYAAAAGPATNIIRLVEAETNNILEQRVRQEDYATVRTAGRCNKFVKYL
jgi:hypothetical protein